MPPSICDSLFLSPVTTDEIQLEIAKLQTGKAVGPSSLPISILKILNPLTPKIYMYIPFICHIAELTELKGYK